MRSILLWRLNASVPTSALTGSCSKAVAVSTAASAGLIDEISLLILPVADGSVNMPMTFDRAAVPATSLQLVSVEQLQGDVVYLRYRPG
ncbi:dihydrofolate reductase family protein [Rhizobium sp. BK060]|uniref:dihydrofolate reductase family protein n=1 Tax=Rhizobium sp. BK060 TaxID=2587096 RepID=UPI001FEF9BA4|nr:dihydrofolate reductase family protein [Rhizobium sp. BK060]